MAGINRDVAREREIREIIAREAAQRALNDRIRALRPWLRHHVWCNCKTDDAPDTPRCKCGLAALATLPSEPVSTPEPFDYEAHNRYMDDVTAEVIRSSESQKER